MRRRIGKVFSFICCEPSRGSKNILGMLAMLVQLCVPKRRATAAKMSVICHASTLRTLVDIISTSGCS